MQIISQTHLERVKVNFSKYGYDHAGGKSLKIYEYNSTSSTFSCISKYLRSTSINRKLHAISCYDLLL